MQQKKLEAKKPTDKKTKEETADEMLLRLGKISAAAGKIIILQSKSPAEEICIWAILTFALMRANLVTLDKADKKEEKDASKQEGS